MPYRFGFSQEEGGWKLDLLPLLRAAATPLERAIRASGRTEDDFLIVLLERGTGKTVSPTIWSPPAAR